MTRVLSASSKRGSLTSSTRASQTSRALKLGLGRTSLFTPQQSTRKQFSAAAVVLSDRRFDSVSMHSSRHADLWQETQDKDAVGELTGEILETVRAKFARIQELRKLRCDKKRSLAVDFVKARDHVTDLGGEGEVLREDAEKIEYTNGKIKEDCDRLQREIERVQANINYIQRGFGERAAGIESEILAATMRTTQENALLERERQQAASVDKMLTEDRQVKQKRLGELVEEVEELKRKVADMQEREGEQIEKFVNKSHTLDVSLNIMKTLSTTGGSNRFPKK